MTTAQTTPRPTERESLLTRVMWDVIAALTRPDGSYAGRVGEALRLINAVKPTLYEIGNQTLYADTDAVNRATSTGPAIACSTPVVQLIAEAVERLYRRLPDGEVVPMSVADLRVMAKEILRDRYVQHVDMRKVMG